jgi:hypothetical protein
MALRSAASSVVAQSSTSIPKRGRNSVSTRLVPPYVSWMETMRSPGDSSVKSVFDTAAIPVAKLVAASAPSSSRTLASKRATVGFVLRA